MQIDPNAMSLDDWLALLETTDQSGTVRAWPAAQTRPGETKRGTIADDTVVGGRDDDTLRGLTGDDRLVGRAGDDRLIGGGGDDFLIGGGGDDQLRGGGGADDLRGGGGADNLKSGGGNDTIKAGGGKDLANGGGGDDRVEGGGGTDTLIGNRGDDTLKGGGGADIFQFAARDLAGGAIDVIQDLGRGADKIDLSRFIDVRSLDDLSFGRLDGDVTINIGDGRIKLNGVENAADLNASQFIFFGSPATPTAPTTMTPPMTTPPAVPDPPPTPLGDTRVGGAGADVIPTGPGQDTLIGGTGADTFDIQLENGQLDDTADRVADFSFTAGDQIGVSDALSGVSFTQITDVVRATPTGGDTEIAIDRGTGFQTALVLEGVSFTTADLATYGFDATPRTSAGFVENPYGFQNANAPVADPDATRDGAFVVFADQTNPDGAADDFDVTNSSQEFEADLDIFLRNTETGSLVRVSVDGAGATLKRQDGTGADSHAPSLSGDGRVVAFATNGVGSSLDQNDEGDIYIRDVFNDTAPVLVSVGVDGLAAGGVADPFFAADSTGIVGISADGRKVAFVSTADITGSNQTDANGAADVYLRDLDAGTTTLISTATNGTIAQGVFAPYRGLSDFGGDIIALSEDGRFAAFMTPTPIAATDSSNLADVYLKDIQTGQTLHVTDGFEAGVFGFDMSADGSRIAFLTTSAGAGANDTNNLQDVYVADIDLNAFSVSNTFRASVAADGQQINGDDAESPVISPDGTKVAWITAAEDVDFFNPPGLSDEGDRVFVHDLTTGVVSAPVGPTPENVFIDSDYAVFTDDNFIYRKEVPASGEGSRAVSETLASDGLIPLTSTEISGLGLTTTEELSFFTTVRSEIETAGDTDVFRLFQRPGLTNLRVEVKGVDGNGGTLSDPVLNIFAGQVDGTPDLTNDDFGTRDSRLDFSVNNQLVFIEVSGFGDEIGSYSLSIDTIF